MRMARITMALKLYKPLTISPLLLTSSTISFSTFAKTSHNYKHPSTISPLKPSPPHQKAKAKAKAAFSPPKRKPSGTVTAVKAKAGLAAFSPSKPPPAHQKARASVAVTAALSNAKVKAKAGLQGEKNRTRSDKEFKPDFVYKFGIDKDSHFPVLLGEVLDAFPSSFPLHSFVDCTLGAAGHSSAIIQAHPELQTYVGLDVDPIAHGKSQAQIDKLLQNIQLDKESDLKAHVLLKNFKQIRKVIGEVDDKLLTSGVDGILMDLGMSSMQVNDAGRGFSMLHSGPLDMRMDPEASLTAADILNTWPAAEVGRILKDYGEESNWYFLQNNIVDARLDGGLHTTADLVDVIRCKKSRTKGGRDGWIKTAARVFQALRIAVNDELKTLERALYSCFESLGPGGRLAVISFHSLEDRIVKQTFLDIISNPKMERKEAGHEGGTDPAEICQDLTEKEPWVKQVVKGSTGLILTKRPITPSLQEERLNSRCRSAKLRVIQRY